MEVGLAWVETTFKLGTELNQLACGFVFWYADTFTVVFPLFLLVLIVTFLGRRWLAAWARQFLWTLVLIRLIVPISLTSPLSAQHLWPLIDLVASLGSGRSPFLLLENEDASFFHVRLPPRTQTSWPAPSEFRFNSLTPQLEAVVRPVIVMGALLIAAIYIFALRRLFGWMRYACNFVDPAATEEVWNAKRGLGVGSHIRLRTVHQLPWAVTFDWFRPVILLPETFKSLPASEQKLIVWHETARLRRADSATSVLLSVVRMIHWWNPLFWWIQSCWTLERELACDKLVVDHLGEAQAAEYARTLERIHQTSSERSRFFVDDAPGFVSFVQWKSILPQRLRALTGVCRSEGRFCYWFSWCVVSCFAVMGLTDAEKRSPQDQTAPIQLPTGTTWHDALATGDNETEMETRTYDLSACVSLAQKEHVGWPVKSALDNFQSSIRFLLQTSPSADSTEQFIARGLDSEGTSESQCELIDQQLVVRASVHQHDRIARLISEWSNHGLKQIILEFRWITTSLELSHLLPRTGGKIFNSEFSVNSQTPTIRDSSRTSAAAFFEQTIRSPAQVFVRRLSLADAMHLLDEVQRNVRSNLLFAPKVTIFNGQSANVTDQRQHSFITGVRSSDSGFDPTVAKLDEGAAIQMFAYLDGEKISVHASYRVSTITHAEHRTLRTESQETRLDVPFLREHFVRATAVLASQETLLIVPLQRDPQGQLTFFLITPRILEETGF